MARKFISFLGTTGYKPATYELYQEEGGSYTTSYIQEALVNILCSDWSKDDEAIIFLTDMAEEENWNNVKDENRRLKDILGQSHLSFKGVKIPDGRSEEEIWEIFEIVSSQIKEGDEIILDITHGFRSIPLLATIVLNYVKVVQNAKVLGVYYGVWEAKDTSTPPIAPIFNMTPLVEIQEWAQATNTFLRYGNSEPLMDVSMQQLNPLVPTKEWARETRNFIKSLNNFTGAINTGRGKQVQGVKCANERSIMAAYKVLNNNLELLKTRNDTNLKPLIPLIHKIEKRIQDFDEENVLKSGMATIQWCIDHKLIQQALTALEETITTYLCQKFNLDPNAYEDREDIVGTALGLRIAHLQSGGKNLASLKENVKEEYFSKTEEVYDGLQNELVVLANKIKGSRNDINHFGFSKEVETYRGFEKKTKEYFSGFKEIISLGKKMFLVFSHQLTEAQKQDAYDNWEVEEFVCLPDDLQNSWGNISPTVESLDQSLRCIFEWIEENAGLNDCILVQGEFGATYQTVKYLKNKQYTVLYSTTKREAIEQQDGHSEVTLTHKISHVRYREY